MFLKKLSRFSGKMMALTLGVIVLASFLLPVCGEAKEPEKVVRVGWYNAPISTFDKFGRRQGYTYEFQRKVAAYANWKFEYVEGNWPDLLQMLIRGEIDVLSDISYTEERAESLLFPAYPMGSEDYYIFVAVKNSERTRDSLSWFNGKKIGVNKGSVQTGYFLEWQEKNNIKADLIELSCPEEESFSMVQRGELDAFVTIDAYGGREDFVPTVKIGSSDYYLAVKKERRDLLEDINAAMARILEENKYYTQQLSEKYLRTSGASLYMSPGEKEWLAGHGAIRVGYQDDYLAFCATDERTGELTGALKDFLDFASDCLENAHLDFEPVAYPTAKEAIAALQRGEVDCMFPSNLGTSDGESLGLIMTQSMVETEVYALVRKADEAAFGGREKVVTAVKEGDPNYASVVMDFFPDWQTAEYPDIESCLKAVSKGNADCVLISNYQYNSIRRLCEKYDLTSLATGKEVEYFVAVNSGEKELYSILTKTIGLVNGASINAALTYYSAEEAKTGFIDFVRENPFIIISAVVVVLAMLAVIITQNMMIRARREARDSNDKVEVLNKRVFLDGLTNVLNKAAFNDIIQDIQNRINQNEKLAFSIAVFDCDHLKEVNDGFGHVKGDEYLKKSAAILSEIFVNSPVYRIGGDEYAVILKNDDYVNRESLIKEFEKKSAETLEKAENEWEKVSMSMGITDFDPENDRYIDDVVQRADELMYKNKRARNEYR